MRLVSPRVLSPVLGLLLSLGCQTREPTSTAPKPAAKAEPSAPSDASAAEASVPSAKEPPSTNGKLDAADLVRVELGRVPEAARAALAERLGPASPLSGTRALVAVHHHIAPGWHIYWINPGDSGLRTRIDGEASGARLGEVLYPAPDRIVAEGGQVSYGWDDDAVLFVPLRALDDDAQLSLRSRYLVCRESCISGETTLVAALGELGERSDPLTAKMLERVPEPAGDRVRAQWRDGELRLRAAEGLQLTELFPYASNATVLEQQAVEPDGALTLHYRFPGTPEDAAQGVLRATLAGAPRWLELAVPWPARPAPT